MTPPAGTAYEKIVVNHFGGPEALQLQQATTAIPPVGHSLVQLTASGVGYTDIMARKGEYLFQRKRPFTPGYECAGTVVASCPDGTETAELAVGTRVAACLPKMGTYAQYISVPTIYLVPVPAAVSFDVAAGMSLNYLTALAMLERSVRLQPGDSVLIQGAAGGVGEALCQLGKQMGLTMYGTASAKDFDKLTSYGVQPIEYKQQDFAAIVRQQEPAGLQAVFDHIGGKNLTTGYQLLAPGGTLVSYAFMGRPGHILFDTLRGAVHNRLLGLRPGKHTRICSLPPLIKADPAWYRARLARLFDAATQGQITPRIGHRFALQDAGAAQALLESHQANGKIILQAAKTSS